MKEITNYEEFKFECELAFLEDIFFEGEKEFKNVNLPKIVLNQSSLYLFPALKLEKVTTDFVALQKLGFINMYIYFKEIPIEYCLHLLFNPAISKEYEFQLILEKFKGLSGFTEVSRLDENVYVLSIMMQKEYRNVFYPFINSKYSKMGSGYASLFPHIIEDGSKKQRKQYGAINHTQEFQIHLEKELGLKEGLLDRIELDKKLDLKKEILNYNYIKNDSNR